MWDGRVTLIYKVMSSVSQLLPRKWQGSIVDGFLSGPPCACWLCYGRGKNVGAELQMLEDED